MKLLMIGMDGASRQAFERGWTPYISELMKKGRDLAMKTDLYSRGWLEIATAEHSRVTGAMYDRPKCNGTLEWQEQFKIGDIPGLGEAIKPIWQSLNEQGASVGIMNLPTTFPAPEVDGFFVSGGGGGGGVSSAPEEDQCFPRSIHRGLIKEGYIVDERIVQFVVEKKMSSPKEIFERLAHKNQRRTRSFIRLANEFNIDFGFVVYKTSSVLAENFVQVDWFRRCSGLEADDELLRVLESYYREFDSEVKKLHEAFPETDLLFVADHGMARRTHSVNPNVFLEKSGYQVRGSSSSWKFELVKYSKKVLPFWLKMALKKQGKIKAVTSNVVPFDSSLTRAFARTFGDWRYGVYVNDKDRFGGPVDKNKVQELLHELVEKFNSEPSLQAHGITARLGVELCPRKDCDSPWFPDLVLDMPDGYLVTDKSRGFIEEYKVPEDFNALGAILRGDIVSIKSTTPATVYCPSEKSNIDLSKKRFDKLVDVENLINSVLYSTGEC